MAEFKTNRKHMTASNLHKGKALVSDYKDYQPSYMKATTVTKPGNLASGGDKLYKSKGPDMGRDARTSRSDGNSVPGRKAITETRTGPGRVTSVPKTGKLKGILSNYSDGPNQKVLRGQFKENLSKKVSQDSKPNKSNAPRPDFNKKKKSNKRVHHATKMAQKLMGGGTKRY